MPAELPVRRGRCLDSRAAADEFSMLLVLPLLAPTLLLVPTAATRACSPCCTTCATCWVLLPHAQAHGPARDSNYSLPLLRVNLRRTSCSRWPSRDRVRDELLRLPQPVAPALALSP